jgi:protein Cut8
VESFKGLCGVALTTTALTSTFRARPRRLSIHKHQHNISTPLLCSAAIMNVLSVFVHHQLRWFCTDGQTASPYSSTMSGRKRKAEDDGGYDDSMSVSPAASPAINPRPLARPMKKSKANDISGAPLDLPTLLETFDAESLRTVLQAICERHPAIGSEVVTSAPRPSVASTLSVLSKYQNRLRAAFPYSGNGGNDGSDYAYNRVRQELVSLLELLSKFTRHFLPPNESQVATSLSYLDGATEVIHELPDWESSSHKHHKDDAYDEISKAWALVISEASKRAGGFQLHSGEWDQKLTKHNARSGGRMQAAINALGSNLSWIGGNSGTESDGRSRSIRDELLSGTYGSNLPGVRVGPW